jgi:hypothetical protein
MRRLPLLAAIAAATACLLPDDPAGVLAVSVSLSTTHVLADSGMVVRLEARNPTLRTIHLPVCGYPLDYYFVAPDGERVDSPGSGCYETRDVEVAPGETLVREFTWYPTPHVRNSDLIRWAPGRYQIVGILYGENVVRESEPVTFDLVCHDAKWSVC